MYAGHRRCCCFMGLFTESKRLIRKLCSKVVAMDVDLAVIFRFLFDFRDRKNIYMQTYF